MEDFCKENIKDRLKTCWARKRDAVVEDGEKKTLVEATSELFFAETFKLHFFSRNVHYRPTMLEYCLIWWVACLYCTTDFPSKEDSGGSTQIYQKRCLIKLVWRVKESEDDSSWASCSSWPHMLWIRLVKKSVAISTDTKSDLYSIAVCLHLWDTYLKAIYFHVSRPMMSFYYPDSNI